MKVLIVENSPRVRRMIRYLISEVATEVFECERGNLALAAYRAQAPDWVLMDIGLKGLDGLAATRCIKAAHPEARIAILNSYNDPGLRRAAHKAGACAYLLKDSLIELRDLLSVEPCKEN